MHISFLCIRFPDASLMQYWKENMPDALDTERVRLEGSHAFSSHTLSDASADIRVSQVQNFFDPQPAREEDVSVFLVCQIFHNWADEYCVRILKQLRAAAGPKTELVIFEQQIAYACDEPASHEIPGAELSAPPKPLLPNWGRAGSTVHGLDIIASLYGAEWSKGADI
jgi:hypothetical protein